MEKLEANGVAIVAAGVAFLLVSGCNFIQSLANVHSPEAAFVKGVEAICWGVVIGVITGLGAKAVTTI